MIAVHGLAQKEQEVPVVKPLNLEFFTKDLSYLTNSKAESKSGAGQGSDKAQYSDVQKQIRRVLRDMKRIITKTRVTTTEPVLDMSDTHDDTDDPNHIEDQTEIEFTSVPEETMQMADDEMSSTIQHVTEGMDQLALNESDDEDVEDDQFLPTPSMTTPMIMLSASKMEQYRKILLEHGFTC